MIDPKKRLEEILKKHRERPYRHSVLYRKEEYKERDERFANKILKEFVYKDNLPSADDLKVFVNNLIYFENRETFYNRKPFNCISDWFPINNEYLPDIIAEAIRKLIEGSK